MLAWYSHFKDLSALDFQKALKLAINSNTSGFPPVPGQVWEAHKSLNKTLDDLESADQAWDSAWNNKQLSPLAYKATELMHDWKGRGYWPLDTLHFKKREFEKIFNNLKEQRDHVDANRTISNQLNSNEINLLKRLGMQ